jgi:hypothetical protein
MPVALTYDAYVAELQVLAQFNPSDPNFTANLPSALNYAEDRINRELDLLNTIASNSSLALTAGTRSLDITDANINVLEKLNVITPYTQADPDLGTRNPCTFVTQEFLDWTYGSNSVTGVPVNWTRQSDHILLFGPFPDQAYTVELVGTVWQQSLSAGSGTQTTWISSYVPELLLAASMISMSGSMRNFGSQADDPRLSQSWETQYQTLMKSAQVEDARRKFKSQGWTSDLPEPTTTPRT